MVYIRADGGREIGIGHVMRCISIAIEIVSAGLDVCFILANDSMKEHLLASNFKFHVLDTDYRTMDDEISRLNAIFKNESPDIILVDSYYATPNYINYLRDWAPVAYLDDLGRVTFQLDILINYNIFAKAEMYRNLATRSTDKLLGVDFSPVRREFCGVGYVVRKEFRSILITTGGSDKYNLTGKFVEAIINTGALKNMDCYVVCGSFNVNLPCLEAYEQKYSNIHICKNVTKMSQLMQKCDVAITAGGSTMYELSAVGVPMLCFSFVDNQKQIAKGFMEKQLVAFAGDYIKQGDDMVNNAMSVLVKLSDYDIRADYSRRLRETVDGLGASRIARSLIGMSKR